MFRHLYIVLSVTIILLVTKVGAQKVLNGSFEINSLPSCGYTNYYNYSNFNSKVPYVFLNNSVSFDIWNQTCSYSGSSIILASDGDWFIRPGGDSSGRKSDSISLMLSTNLSIGVPYVIQFDLCSITQLGITKDSLIIGLSLNSNQFGKKIGGYIPKDSTGYRSFSIGFVSDKLYGFIGIATANSRQFSGCILDNVRLDTCVHLLGTRKVVSNSCNPFPFQLSAREKGIEYNWNYRDTTEQIWVQNPGWHIAYIYDSVGCVAIDSIEIVIDSTTSKHSFKNLTGCANDTLILTSSITSNSTWQWSNGSSETQLVVDTTGLYICIANSSGCIITDSFEVFIIPQTELISFSDTGFCEANSINVTAFNPFYNHYVWDNGDTNANINIKLPGPYKVTASYLSCTITDSFNVSVSPHPSLNLPNDTTVCKGDSVFLNAFNGAYDRYLWKSGDTSSYSNYFSQADTIWVIAYNKFCQTIDSTILHVEIPAISNLPDDTSFCENSPILIDASIPSYNEYLWNDGVTKAQYLISNPSTYSVLISNGICSIIDSIIVKMNPSPILHLPQDTTVCFDELKSILLDAGIWKSYDWYPTGEHTRTINATYPELYRVVVTDYNNCIGTDTALIEEDCPDAIYFPNAFTPNNDGLNDIATIRGFGISQCELKIFNRWGVEVFRSTDMNIGWDGNIKGLPAEPGVYAFHIQYHLKKNNTIKSQIGTITLLR